MKFYGGVRCSKINKCLECGNDPYYQVDCPIKNLAITQHIMIKF